MRWDPGHESPDVIDRRGEGGRGPGQLGTWLAFLPLIGRSRYGWIFLLLVIVGAILSRTGGTPTTGDGAGQTRVTNADNTQVEFVSFVLDDVQKTWEQRFAADNRLYRHAKLVLFTDAIGTACGYGQAATGPFYCPNDERVYIDLGFYDELARRFGARGDFAQAYVIAHEIGHHVQKLMGISDREQNAAGAALRGPTSASVRLELQADCLAGVWAKSTEKEHLLEPGDLDEALGAAAAIGDDRLQRMSTGRVAPERWTHGSSDERSRWLRRGYEEGTLEACDTFSAKDL